VLDPEVLAINRGSILLSGSVWMRGIASSLMLGLGGYLGTRQGINMIQYENSLTHDHLKPIRWARFDKLVDEHDANRAVRRLTTKSQLVTLIQAQLSGAVSLRSKQSWQAMKLDCTTSALMRRVVHCRMSD